MGLFGSSDPAVQQEKLINKEAKGEEKSLKNVIKEVGKLEKEQAKTAKAESHAHHDLEKATKVEHKAAEKLNKVTEKHDSAVIKQNAAANDVKHKEEQHQRTKALLEEKKAQLDNLQHNHHANEAARAEKLDRLHATKEGNTAAPGTGVVGNNNVTPGTAYSEQPVGGQPIAGQHVGEQPIAGQPVGGAYGEPGYAGQTAPATGNVNRI